MKNIIKTLLIVMTLVIALVAFTGCEVINETKCAINGHTMETFGEELPTCTEDGLSSGIVCTVCGYAERNRFPIPATGHNMADATCELPSTCKNDGCDYTEGEALGHNMVEVPEVAPTCSAVGYTAHMACDRKGCTATQGKEEIAINPDAHSMVEVEALDPTCTKTGYTAHTACEHCGLKDEAYSEIPATEAHQLDESTCFYYPAAPTCTEGAYIACYCTTCGEAYIVDEVPALGHVDENGDYICDVEGCGAYANPYFAAGNGTAEDPFIIETAEQLANISLFYDTYNYYKVADGVETIDMTGVGKIYLHGSFDGNGVKLVNLTTALFYKVGYENSVEEIKISNVDATLNNIDGCAFVRNIFNGGKTTFENVHLHGYVEGLYNMGSFYNYGTANCDGVGADYTVEFVNSTSDITIVCTSGSVAGGFLGHSYEGAGKAFTMIVDANSAFTGKILTTNGKGNLYFAMTSDYNNSLNKFVIAGEEVHFDNGHIPAAANLGKIAVVKPTAGANGYEVAPVEGVASYVVYLNAQVTAYDENGFMLVNKNGLTWPLGHFDLETLAGYGLITSATIVNGTDHEFGYEIVDGVLTIYSGRSASYESGNVYLQVNQYDAEGNLLATGTLTVYVIEHDHTFLGGDCTTDGVCNCGAKEKATGHDYDHVVTDPTCTLDGYTTHTCAICDYSYTDSTVVATGHADNNGDYKCDKCSTKMLPADGTTLTITQALAIAKMQAHNTYTTQKYYITGIVTGLYNTQYGNFYIKDDEGNEICIYGLYSADGKTRYDAMSYKPVNGDEVTVYTVLGAYNSTYQGKNAWLDDVVAHEHDYKSTVTEPTCFKDGFTTHTCSVCGDEKVDTPVAALGHTTEAGTCDRCGTVIGEEINTDPVTVSKTMKELITANGWTSNTTKQSFNLDNIVSVKINGGSNTGKAYNGDHIRIYATDSPAGTITISVPDGYELVSIKITAQTGTYAYLYVDGTTTNICNKTVEVSGSSVLLKSVKNGSDGKQVRVTAIEVTYKPVG